MNILVIIILIQLRKDKIFRFNKNLFTIAYKVKICILYFKRSVTTIPGIDNIAQLIKTLESIKLSYRLLVAL